MLQPELFRQWKACSGCCRLLPSQASCWLTPSLLQDGGRQSRQVKLLCACVTLVLQRQPAALAESLPELLAFCIQARGS